MSSVRELIEFAFHDVEEVLRRRALHETEEEKKARESVRSTFALVAKRSYAAKICEEMLSDIKKIEKKYIDDAGVFDIDAAETARITIAARDIVTCGECRYGQHDGSGVVCCWGGEERRPHNHYCAWGVRRSLQDEDFELNNI